jgi:hypothetical protein
VGLNVSHSSLLRPGVLQPVCAQKSSAWMQSFNLSVRAELELLENGQFHIDRLYEDARRELQHEAERQDDADRVECQTHKESGNATPVLPEARTSSELQKQGS